jgi:hypothetical protein
VKFSKLLIFLIIVFINFNLNPLFTYGTSIVLEICDNKLDDDNDDIVDEPLCVNESTVLEICDNKLDDDNDDIVDEPLCVIQNIVS